MSDTQTAQQEQLAIPGVEELRAELDMALPATIETDDSQEPKLEKQADELIEQLLAIEMQDKERLEEARNAVESMGLGAQQDAARRSAMLNEPLKTLATRAEDGGDVAKSLIDLRIKVEMSHHEVAIGQHEIDFRYSDALHSADNAITFKYTVKGVAAKHGLFATFVAAAVAKGRPQLWLAAIGLHAGHDVLAHRIGSLGETVSSLWLAASLVGYTGVILWLRKRWFSAERTTG